MILIGLISISIFGCANVKHKPQLFQGENLITPYSGFLAGWKVSVENKKHYHSRMWQHPELGFKSSYVVSVTPREKIDVLHFRKIIDEPGNDSCLNFTSKTINLTAKPNYPQTLWQTQCLRKDNSEARILHLLIQGNDSLYHIQKIWQGEHPPEDISLWQNRFQQIYVCNTRSLKAHCPQVNG